jgi:hypothetical protein
MTKTVNMTLVAVSGKPRSLTRRQNSPARAVRHQTHPDQALPLAHAQMLAPVGLLNPLNQTKRAYHTIMMSSGASQLFQHHPMQQHHDVL